MKKKHQKGEALTAAVGLAFVLMALMGALSVDNSPLQNLYETPSMEEQQQQQ